MTQTIRQFNRRHLGVALAVAALFTTAARARDRIGVPEDHPRRIEHGLRLFQQYVRGLLTTKCIECHGAEKKKGGLDLSTREGLLKGGDDGEVIIPFNADQSRLLRLLRHEEEPYMPNKKAALAREQIAKITEWIDDGAPYDKPLVDRPTLTRDRSVVTDEDRRWWAFQPLTRPKPPQIDAAPVKPQNPIDQFILSKAAGMALSPVADRRTLARRAYLDLLGLPPSPDEVETFTRDESPDAWPRLIDQLLASPRYGERWARYWLDVARFAESSGFEHDYDRPGAFQFRDFVIRALNDDLPFDQFARWQLAGDEFAPDDPLALTATGFLGAGVFPTQITANEVERTRYDALDDMLATTGSAFLGLTIGCARCHDHKYDPIPTRDYYRMLSAFTATVRSVVDLDVEPGRTHRLVEKWAADYVPLLTDLNHYEAALQPRFEAWLASGARNLAEARWATLNVTTLTSKTGATFKRLADGSFLAEGKNGDQDEYILTGLASGPRLAGLRLDALADASLPKSGPGRAENGNFGLSRVRVFCAAGGTNEAQEIPLTGPRADFEQNTSNLSIASSLDDNPSSGWAVDGQIGKDHAAAFKFERPIDAPTGASLTVTLEFRVNTRHNLGRFRVSTSAREDAGLKEEALPASIAALLARAKAGGAAETWSAAERASLFGWWKRSDPGWAERSARLERHRATQPTGLTKALICAEGHEPLRYHSQGADFFKETYYLKRGNTDLKDGVATEGFLQALMRGADGPSRWQWNPPPGALYSGRRRSLANWLTDTDHGAGNLLARVAVNRLWQHHFGRGIVPTPNDFGHAGDPPSHPELLDWLAGQLIDHQWKLKSMHRLLMTSATYMQACVHDPRKESADPDDHLFVRRAPQRLEGEAIRDAMLSVSGQLDPAMFGPGTKDERSRRRSIYFTIKRSQLVGSMVVFDQPEPLVSQGARPTTTVAPQALLLMNSPQVRDWADALARRMRRETADVNDLAALTRRGYALTLGRPPTPDELSESAEFLRRQARSYAADSRPDANALALVDFAQVLFGLNEFIYEN